MSYSPVVVERFGGLKLNVDPVEVGLENAVDLADIDLKSSGEVQVRAGTTTLASATGMPVLADIVPFYKTDDTAQLVGVATTPFGNASSKVIVAFDGLGNLLASKPGGSVINDRKPYRIAGRFGTPTADLVYISSAEPGGSTISYKWNGSTFTDVSGLLPAAQRWGIQASDNRMMGGNITDVDPSRVQFSDSGDAETWGANNYVSITPGDGEKITAIQAWRDLVFVFKETKFAVFTGTSIDGDGNPVFNYRMVNSGDGVIGGQAVCAGRDGVYFVNERGVYHTTGDTPVLISRDIDTLFPSNINPSAYLSYVGERLYVGTSDGTYVYDTTTQDWMFWTVPMRSACGFSRDGADATPQTLTFAHGTGGSIAQFDLGADDNGTPFEAFYQSGVSDLGSADAKVVRQVRALARISDFVGSGTLAVNMSVDRAAFDTGSTLTLDAWQELRDRTARRGTFFSYQLTGLTFRVSRLVLDVRDSRATR